MIQTARSKSKLISLLKTVARASSLPSRFGGEKDIKALDQNIENANTTVQDYLDDYSVVGWAYVGLANLRLRRFEISHVASDLDEATLAARKAEETTKDDDPDFAMKMAGLGTFFTQRFSLTEETEDIEQDHKFARLCADATAAHASPGLQEATRRLQEAISNLPSKSGDLGNNCGNSRRHSSTSSRAC